VYFGLLTVVIGQALSFGSGWLLLHAAVGWVVAASFVRWCDKPTLVGTCGEPCERLPRCWGLGFRGCVRGFPDAQNGGGS
jgi:hypothetical protein